MAVGDIYSYTLVSGSIYATQNILNVFFYRQSSINNLGVSTPAALSQAFQDRFLNGAVGGSNIVDIIALQGFVLGNVIYNLFNPEEILSEAFTPAYDGTRGTAPMPTFTSWGFRSSRVRRDIRRGRKRIGPVAEADTSGNQADAAIVPALENVATKLGVTIFQNDSPLTSPYFVPVVVKRIKEVDASGKVTYRLPTTPAEAETFDATEWEYYNLTTQNSRKQLP